MGEKREVGDEDTGEVAGTGHVGALGALAGASREMMMAETPEEIAAIAVETVQQVLELPVVVLYRTPVPGAPEELSVVAATPAAESLLDGDDSLGGDPPPERAAVGSETPVVHDDPEGAADRRGPDPAVTVEVHAPVGERGVLVAGSESPTELADDVDFVRLLAATVETALDRAERESLLRERERQLRESREQIQRLHEAAASMVGCRTEDELYQLAVDTAEEVLDLDMSSLLVEDGDWLVPRAVSSGTPEDGVRRMRVEEGMAGKTYRTGQSYLTEDMREEGAAKPVKETYRSAISIPVGEFGVFQAVAERPGAFADRDVEFAELLLSHVSETASRIRAEQELRNSEAKFRQIAENVESVVWMSDREREELLYVSPAFEAVWGRPRESAEDDPEGLLEAVHDIDRERVRAAIGNRPDEYDLQYRIVHPDEGVRWVHDRAFPIEDGDGPGRVVGLTTDVTERKRREQELERYETVFRTVQDRVYVLDEAGRFRMVNEPLLELLGYDREELLGEHVSLIVDDAAVGRIQRAGTELLSSDDDATTMEVAVHTADGDVVPCETEIAVLPADELFQGTVGVMRDVTERKRVEAQLQHERDRLSVLFENLPDPVVEAGIDDDLRVQSINPAFERVFGVDAAEVQDRPLAEFIFPPDADLRHTDLEESIRTGARFQAEVRRRTDDGIRHFLLRGIPFESDADTDAGPSGFGIYTDISDQKRRQRQLQVLNRVLRHNLRNDMNKIIGYADLLSVKAEEPERARQAEVIRRTASNIVGLSEKVRQLGSILDEDVERRRPIDAVALIEEALEPYHRRPDVEVTTDLPPGQAVDADARLRLALENVLDNAIEHSDRPTPTVHVGVEAVDVERGEWVEVRIADDGPGIPEHERSVLTDEGEITQLEHGSGLGLWLVSWVITALGGEVLFEDNDPRGSTITFRLRAADHDDVTPIEEFEG